MYGMRLFVNVIGTLRYRYSLASRIFPRAKNSVVYAKFRMSSIFNFSQLIFIYKYLKFKEIEYLIHYVKFEI